MLEINNISVEFDNTVIIKDFSLKINTGITAIMGESGCGKTTLLNTVSGLVKATSGTIKSDGKGISCIFSEPRLLPWYSAEKNIRIVNNSITDEHLSTILSAFEMTEFRHKLPSELSAGMAQRVSIARAIAYDSDILLMDEPFKALDFELKQRVMKKTAELFGGKYIIFITHELSEAQEIADRIITVSGTPLTVINDVNI